MPHYHVHLHDDFEESKHPRGKGGKFAKGAQHVATAAKRGAQATGRAAGTAAHAVGAGARGAARGVGAGARAAAKLPASTVAMVKSFIHNATAMDMKVFEEGHHRANSEARKTWGKSILNTGKTLGNWLKAHGKHRVHNAKAAAGCVKTALTPGQKTTPEQRKELYKFTFGIAVSAFGAVTHGDPTGTAAHIAWELAQEFSMEFVQHTVGETAITGGGGYFRHRLQVRARGRMQMAGGDAAYQGNDDLTPEEMQLLQEYLERFAKYVVSAPMSDRRMAQLMAQRRGGQGNGNGSGGR